MWRSVLFSVLTSFIIPLSSGCLFTDQKINRNTNQASEVNTNVPNSGDLIEFDPYEFVEEHLAPIIKETSQKIGSAPLPKTARPDEFEFRIWSNPGGRGDAKLLIVRSDINKNQAYFFDINKGLNPIGFRKEHLTSPKAGWNRMLFEVRSQLTAPKGLVRDPQFDIDRDEGVIFLEVLDKEEYRRLFYEQSTSFQDGKRLIELCKYLSSEFDVDMDCYADH